MCNLFDAKIVLFQQDIESKEEVFKLLSNELMDKGYVKDSFYHGLIQREKEYPTGLLCGNIGVAIPHTDIEHVNKPQIAFMNLKKPITFIHMGSDNQKIEVSILFVLALNHGDDQMNTIMSMMELFQNAELLNEFASVDNYEDYYALVKKAKLV